MTRYTKKNDKNYGCKMNEYMWADKSYNHSRLGIDKLGELEDIEEELGVDLIKLLARKPMFRKNGKGIISECMCMLISIAFKQLDCSDIGSVYIHLEKFSDYGKTWAFTKEELE